MPTYRSVPETFLRRVSQTPDREAFRFPQNSGWGSLTWKQTSDQVKAIASGLRALGLQTEQRCAILSGTRVEWILADLGILCAGGAVTTIYPSNTARECAYIVNDSDTVIAFAETDDQVAKFTEQRSSLPRLRQVVVIDGAASADGWVITLDRLKQLGASYAASHPGELEQQIASVKPDSLATLIYTSGTTGQPKGVELTHDCWLYEGEGIDSLGILTADDLQYLWLPLAHSFGKVLEMAQLRIGFCSAVDGRVERLVDNLAAIKPTFVCGVPRIFEKVHNKVAANARDGGELKNAIFHWAVRTGRNVSRLRQRRESIPLTLALQNAVADRLVFQKLKHRFGGRLRFFISGSAPLSREIAEFFDAAGITILEGYGLTESSAGSCVNLPADNRLGTVGPPLRGTELRISPEDGEVLIRGRGVMRGYHNLPEQTAEVLSDGWLRTGDIGELDRDGYLRITDRKKDLIKTSGGKYVAPQLLEGKFKAICQLASQILVHGNNRNYCAALVTLDEEAVRTWAEQNKVANGSYAQLVQNAQLKGLVKGCFDELNSELPSYSTIKKFAILTADFSIEAGELTPSMKVKRKVVEQKYKRVLDELYSG